MPASFQGLSLNDGATKMHRDVHTIRVSTGVVLLVSLLMVTGVSAAELAEHIDKLLKAAGPE